MSLETVKGYLRDENHDGSGSRPQGIVYWGRQRAADLRGPARTPPPDLTTEYVMWECWRRYYDALFKVNEALAADGVTAAAIEAALLAENAGIDQLIPMIATHVPTAQPDLKYKRHVLHHLRSLVTSLRVECSTNAEIIAELHVANADWQNDLPAPAGCGGPLEKPDGPLDSRPSHIPALDAILTAEMKELIYDGTIRAAGRRALRPDAFSRSMYRGWEEYYADLAALDEVVLGMKKKEIDTALKYEQSALNACIAHLANVASSASGLPRTCILGLKSVLEADRDALGELRDKVTPPPGP